MIGDLTPLQQDVEGDDGGSRFQNAVIDDREVGQVGAAQRHLVARAHPAASQEVCHFVRRRVDLGIGHPHRSQHQGFAIGIPPRGVLKENRKIQQCRPLVLGSLTNELPERPPSRRSLPEQRWQYSPIPRNLQSVCRRQPGVRRSRLRVEAQRGERHRRWRVIPEIGRGIAPHVLRSLSW